MDTEAPGTLSPKIEKTSIHSTLRLPKEVFDFYAGFSSRTGKMREVLAAYARSELRK